MSWPAARGQTGRRQKLRAEILEKMTGTEAWRL